MGFLDRLKAAILPDYSNVPRPGGEPLGGAPGRALVVKTSGSLSGDERPTWAGKTLQLQVVGRPEERAKVDCWFSEREFIVTTPGTEVPVRLHAQTGAILGVDYEAWTAEVEQIYATREASGSGGPAVST